MIITINGTPGSGKSTVAGYLAKKLHMMHYSIGDLRRKIALEKGMTIDEYNKLGEKEEYTDNEIDNYQKSLGKKADNFIVDGRLSWYFIPKSVKIFVKSDLKKAAERVFRSKRRSESRYRSANDVLEEMKNRIKSDSKRYMRYYGIKNMYSIKNYDIIIDTSCLKINEMNKEVFNALKALKKA